MLNLLVQIRNNELIIILTARISLSLKRELVESMMITIFIFVFVTYPYLM